MNINAAHPIPAELGESPLWSVAEQCLYYVDIPGRELRRFDPASGELKRWPTESEPGSIALLEGGGLLLAQRAGLYKVDTATGAQTRIAEPPYDPAKQRFNDGKPDAAGRFWVGTIDDARTPSAHLYRYAVDKFETMAGGITTSNGLAWSPDGRTQYWTDTKAHEIYRFDFDITTGTLGERKLFARFKPRAAGESLESYGGRPDGAAVDVEGCYWVALFEGQRVLRLAPGGEIVQELRLPVRCATMVAFGGPDLRTLYITTAREKRPAEELAAQPLAGQLLQLRVEVAGLPPNIARL
ncbi:MAG: SMP-30/gluconolactonase/LRE family protein [Paucibacter sp.]|nr:SMP-30/gluconolactonase/LRE family protein [Roseateles sp.]